MKPAIPAAILTVAVAFGFSLGWVLNTGTTSTSEGSATTHQPGKPRTRTPRPWASEPPDSRPGKVTVRDSTPAQGEDSTDTPVDELAKAMTNHGETRDESLVSKWVDALQLDADQEERLRQHFAERREAAALLLKDGESDSSASMIAGDAMDEFVADHLSADQQELYASEKNSRQTRKVESRALRDLARLSEAIELTADQRDAIYQQFYQEAAAVASMPSEFPEEGKSDIGVGLKPGEFESSSGTKAAAPPANSPIALDVEELWQAETERQLERLADYLEPEQLEDYRSYLESRQGFLLGSLSR